MIEIITSGAFISFTFTCTWCLPFFDCSRNRQKTVVFWNDSSTKLCNRPQPFAENIQGGPKKLAHFVLYALTTSNIDRFSHFFTPRIRRTFVIILLLRSHHTSSVSLYATLWNVSLKATIENKTTSVTTHFNGASSSSKVDTLNIWCKNCRMRQLLLDNEHVVCCC